MLANHYYEGKVEAGCDEAGRGCLAGSVYAAAVILPDDYQNELLRAVGIVTPEEIDKINILNASILAMHRALDQLKVRPEAIIVDGNRFKPYFEFTDDYSAASEGLASKSTVNRQPSARTCSLSKERTVNKIQIPHTTIVKGDGKYLSIAAASILAKTYRDDYMNRLAEEYPQYDWLSNKGYPTKKHREAIKQYGITPYHRKSYNLLGDGQLSLDFGE